MDKLHIIPARHLRPDHPSGISLHTNQVDATKTSRVYLLNRVNIATANSLGKIRLFAAMVKSRAVKLYKTIYSLSNEFYRNEELM